MSRYFTARDVMTPLRGTPGYMAPEVASQSAYGISSDIFAMGTFLYEMIALRAPYTMNEVHSWGRNRNASSLALSYLACALRARFYPK